jgi:hypothetical protein
MTKIQSNIEGEQQIVAGFRHLPESYTPYDNVIICGNLFRRCGVIFSISGYTPILFGKGAIPQIWLQGPIGRKGEWEIIISEGAAIDPQGNLLRKDLPIFSHPQKILIISYRDMLISELDWSIEDAIRVSRLDLRPIGIDIFGAAAELSVGGTAYHGNMISDVDIAIQYGS